MKHYLQKALTQEQKEIVFELVASWIKSGKNLDECTFDDMRAITDDGVRYIITMDIFKKSLFGITVYNREKEVKLKIEAKDIMNKSAVDYITNYMHSLISQKKGELSDSEFNDITNLEVDLGISRSKKVRRLQERMK